MNMCIWIGMDIGINMGTYNCAYMLFIGSYY